MSVRVQFVHGFEGSPQGAKAVLLGEHFDTLTPGMDTSDFESCVRVQTEQLRRRVPDVLVGSSYGAGVVVEILQRGDWAGPTLLLAQAAVRMGRPLELPPGVPIWIVHGTRDVVIDIADSRRLAAASDPDHVRLIEVEDDHSLTAAVRDRQLLRWVRDLAAGQGGRSDGR